MFSVGISSKHDVVHVFMINFSMKRVFSDVDPKYKILVCNTFSNHDSECVNILWSTESALPFSSQN